MSDHASMPPCRLDAVMALEDDARITIQAKQGVVRRLIQQARAGDPRERSLLIRAHVDELKRRTAGHPCLQLRR